MNVSTTDLDGAVRKTIAELVNVDPGEIKPGDRLMEDLGLDSMQNFELLSRLSEHFDIDPDMEDVNKVVTVEQVVVFLGAYIARKAEAK